MGSPILLLFLSFCALVRSPQAILQSSIYVNFTATFDQLIDEAGAFLVSGQGSFQSRIANSDLEPRSFYLVVIHFASNTIVWTANRNHPISQYGQLRLTADGLTLHNDTSHLIWSTPQNGSLVSTMQLLDSGNLVLLDATKNVLWQSFDFPTDVLVAGQKLRVGNPLVSPSGEGELSEGIYRFVASDDDAMLQWNGMTYWRLSRDDKAFRDTAFSVEFLMMNITGVFLMGGNGKEVVIKRNLNLNSSVNSSDFVYAKLDHRGWLSVMRIKSADRTSEQGFQGPDDKCGIPMICGRLGLCSNGDWCSCPLGFHRTTMDGGCVPKDTSLVLSGSCNNGSSSDDTGFEYLSLRNDFNAFSDDMDYFSNDFTNPVIRGVTLSFCQNLCSRNCSCLGVFHTQTSGSCHMIMNYLGSIKMGSSSKNRAAYVKILAAETGNSDVEKKSDFRILAVALGPCIGVLVIAMVTVVCLRRRRLSKIRASSKLGTRSSHSSADQDMDLVSIPGLPVRLDFEELAQATEGFTAQIGSGGFGTVYKGTLQDGNDVAVKKITCLGAQGKREFLTEIAAIGKIHHINLVRLKGFCTHSGQRLLVYEYLKRSSLDRILFQGEPVLEWKERFEIAVGAARGLAYLHSGCEYKIIHCDVKPENILLNDNLQAKISDFGLSKLLTREQSGFFTTMRGTRGYVAPEWLTNTAISDKTDVYSYGMVLLEIVSGKRNFSLQRQINSPEECEPCLINFPRCALEMHVEKRYMELVDPRLKGNAQSEEVEKLVRVALCCLHREPSLRPSMSNVVRMLEGGMALCKPRMKSLNFLKFYGPGVLAENGRQSEITLDGQETSSATNSNHTFSYISSQQVSGPR